MSVLAAADRIVTQTYPDSAISATIIHHRFFSFLIWQVLQSSAVFLFSQIFVAKNPPTLFAMKFLTFQLSTYVFSTALFVVSSPQLVPFASVSEVAGSLLKMLFVSGGESNYDRVRGSLRFVLFVLVCGIFGSAGLVCVCEDELSGQGFRGFVVGAFYGIWYVWKQRRVLRFPIVQRPPFFSYKMGLRSCAAQALKISSIGYVISGAMSLFLPVKHKMQSTMGGFIHEQIVFFISGFFFVLSWELSHHLLQVISTKRYAFAPPKGSAAAEANPTEYLLDTLEESLPKSLLQHLAYLDMYMVCENNVDGWRRAAFFEESGATYKRVVSACLKPLEEFTRKVAQILESSSAANPLQIPHQPTFPTEKLAALKLHEFFYDSQLYTWCAWTVASLTARSHKEDRFGVAQLTGSNLSVLSTLLSSLLAVETLMGKKTNVQSLHLTSPGGIRWATASTVRRESTYGAMGKLKGSPFYAEAYTLADVLKTSIYCIISAFHDEMLSSSKGGSLEKDWILDGKPLYATKELLLHKLHLFLESQAS